MHEKRKKRLSFMLGWIFTLSSIAVIGAAWRVTHLVQETTKDIVSTPPAVLASPPNSSSSKGDVVSQDKDPVFDERINDLITIHRKHDPNRITRRIILTPEKLNSLTPEEQKIIQSHISLRTMVND